MISSPFTYNPDGSVTIDPKVMDYGVVYNLDLDGDIYHVLRTGDTKFELYSAEPNVT